MKKLSILLLIITLAFNITYAKNEINVKKINERSASFIVNTDSKRSVLVLQPASDSPLEFKEIKQTSLMQETVDLSQIKPISKQYYVVFDGVQNVIPITVKGLQPKTDYVLTLYKPEGEKVNTNQYKFTTLAEEPKKSASGIAFRQPTETSIELVWTNGDGEKRIVVASKGKTVAKIPADGESYSANSKFGSAESILAENAYVVYSGVRNECKVENLEPATIYSFQVIELNGEGKSTNYLVSTSATNPRWKMTAIPAPVLLPAKNVHEIGCVLSWKGSPNVQKYILDIAYDEKFTRFAELYENADVGDITEIEVLDLDPTQDWFVRVKAIGEGSQSEYSKTLKVEKKERK